MLLQLLSSRGTLELAGASRLASDQPLSAHHTSKPSAGNIIVASTWREAAHVKLYVPESLPVKYLQGATGALIPNRTGYGALGELLSAEHQLWNTW